VGRRSVLLVAATGALLLPAAPAAQMAQVALGKALSYQGRLTDTGAPAKGIYDLQFTLFDALRVRDGQAAFVWTDPTLTPGPTVIRVQHILDLRAALAEAYVAAGLPPPTYTDPSQLAGTVARVAHVAELRTNVVAIE
jgi:hypothetical protein